MTEEAAPPHPPAHRFWDDRDAWVVDPQGHRGNLAQRVEDPTPEEMTRRAAAFEAEMRDPAERTGGQSIEAGRSLDRIRSANA